VPAPPPEPTTEELAERDRQAREHKALATAAAGLFGVPAEAVTVSQAARARAVLEASILWAESRPTNQGH
jgi:hypothetical protein